MVVKPVHPVYIEQLQTWMAARQPADLTVCIPTRDRLDLLVPCLLSLARTTFHWPVDVLIGDSGSEPETLDFYERVGLPVVKIPAPFNYSRSCNAMAEAARGQYLLFLNNDTQAVTPDWFPALMDSDLSGVAGCLLVYPKSARLQHAGVEAVHVDRLHETLEAYDGFAREAARQPFMIRHIGAGLPLGQLRSLDTRHSFAVTGAFHVTPRELYRSFNGLDEEYASDLQDIDYCLRLREQGLPVVLCKDILFEHVHSASRPGYEFPRADWSRFMGRWRAALETLAVSPHSGGRP